MTSMEPARQERRKRQPTVIDVAAKAGVAVGTVSRFLNGHPIRQANRVQIERAIATLGYTRNAVAASMKTEARHIVGLLVPNISEFHAGLHEQISRKMRRTGRAVMSYCHDLDRRSILEGIDFFRTHRVDAVIMDGVVGVEDEMRVAVEHGMEIILYDNDIAGLSADRVFVNNRQASRHAVEHLIALGHSRIATITGHQRDTAGQNRLAGYEDALKGAGLAVDPDLVIFGDWNDMPAYEGMRRLMALPNPPTAVFSANYNMTIGALLWCHEEGVRIPEDLSIVSFDDVPAFRLHQPGITCVGQPVEELAEAITTLLAARFEASDFQVHRELTVRCKLTLRGSTARPRTAQNSKGR